MVQANKKRPKEKSKRKARRSSDDPSHGRIAQTSDRPRPLTQYLYELFNPMGYASYLFGSRSSRNQPGHAESDGSDP